MEQIEQKITEQQAKADALGISQGFYSKIYNGYALPSYKNAERWREKTGWTYDRWRKASVSQIQQLLDKIGG